MEKSETPAGSRRTTRGYRRRSAWQAPASTKEKRQQGCRVQKRKSPEQSRGALFYIRESTRLVIALLSKHLSIYKMLKRRTLVCIKKLAPLFQTTETS